MQPRLLTTEHGQYVPVIWNGINESGLVPIGDRVLVLPDKSAEQTDGGVFVSPVQQSRNNEAAETGVLIAMGDAAWVWNSDRTRPYSGVKPQIGQRVWFEKYAGSKQHGDDGLVYRIMDDKCIGGVRPFLKPQKPKPVKLRSIKD